MLDSADDLADLLSRVAAKDRAAFASVYRTASPKLCGIILRILRRRELAEEVLQDVFLTIWRRAEDYNMTLASPMTWMAAIARNRAIDEIRKVRLTVVDTPVEELNVADSGKLASERMEIEESTRRLEKCLDRLTEPHREMVKLAYLHGWSRDALGRKYGRPEGTIKTWLHRSLKQLKECLGS
jgi:RNA polymerase sigma-70 factor (ECF subfamily)